MKDFNISTIENLRKLETELEYEKALAIFKKLRWMIKDDQSLKPKRLHLKELILQFENENWKNDDFRKIVLNAIVWTAHGEVPTAGIASETPSADELATDQDEPAPTQ